MKKNNNDFFVGGAIIISLFILIAGVLWLKEVRISQKMVKYTVLFPNIGSLQKGDPVTVNGVKQGVVAKISLYKAKVAVVIKLDKNIIFTDQSKVTIQNIGLMGERMVGIQLAEKGDPYIPDSKDNVHYIEGYFDSGIAEAMGMLGGVLSEVLILVDTVQGIVDNTVGDDQFITFFNRIFKRLDTIVTLANNLIQDNEKEIHLAVNNLHNITVDLKSLVKTNKKSVNTIIDNGTLLTSEALTIADRIDSITISLNRVISDIDSGKGSIGLLVKDQSLVTDFKTTINDLDSLVKDVKNDALKLRARVKIFGNKKYFQPDTMRQD